MKPWLRIHVPWQRGFKVGRLSLVLWVTIHTASAAGPKGEMQVTDADRQHWAFRSLANVPNPRGPLQPIDAFLAAAGRSPETEASRTTLIRRLYFDLLGLPPTPEQVAAFEQDSRPGAYERLVDELLSSCHYGERWARHWLDVARYADSDGYENDLDRPESWPYRDWVIRAFNEDLPYDTFVHWQVAGDEFAPAVPDAVIATGFLAATPSQETTPADTEENKLKIRYDELDDRVSTTASAFLGLTLGCARCHDHKSDPLPTRDYYRMVAAFSTADRQVVSLAKPQRDFEQWKITLRSAERERRMTELGLSDEQKFWLRQPEHFFVPVQTKLYKEFGEKLKIEDAALRSALTASEKQVWDALEQAAAQFDFSRLPATKSLAVVERQTQPVPQYLLGRGSVLSRRETVSIGFLQVVSRGRTPEDYWAAARTAGASAQEQKVIVDAQGFVRQATTYQRKALASWLTDIQHGAGALTARVIVNRLWQHHFGEGLVRTPNDFGRLGEVPTHPELLEWLAQELVREGWRLKSLQRLIVTSAAYRQKAGDNAHSLRRPVRLDADALLDAMAAVSGRLNRKMFGPPFRPIIPKEAIATRSKDEYPTNLQDGPDLWRRNVYAFTKRSVPNPFTEVFDAPTSSSSCGRRNVTTVPTQALTLMNNDQVRRAATQFAQRVITEAGLVPEAQIERAYRLALGRSATPAELVQALEFLKQAPDAAGDGIPVEGLTDLCHVLFTLNEFIYAP